MSDSKKCKCSCNSKDSLHTIIKNEKGQKFEVSIEVIDAGILIGIKGYGVKALIDGEGYPVLIDFFNEYPQVVIFPSINHEDGIKSSLYGAQERLRKKEGK